MFAICRNTLKEFWKSRNRNLQRQSLNFPLRRDLKFKYQILKKVLEFLAVHATEKNNPEREEIKESVQGGNF